MAVAAITNGRPSLPARASSRRRTPFDRAMERDAQRAAVIHLAKTDASVTAYGPSRSAVAA